jgi:AcrR family transcriptional regulator
LADFLRLDQHLFSPSPEGKVRRLPMAQEERKKKEQARKKNIILRAARKLFFQKGFRAVTVDDIAHRAEISKGAIYLHFSSKEEIYTQLLFGEIEKFHKKIAYLCQGELDASQAIVEFSRVYLDFFLADRELFRILINFMLHPEEANLSCELRHQIIKSTNKNIDIIEDILRMGIARGEFPAQVDTIKSRNNLWGLLNGVVALHLFIGDDEKREEKIRNTLADGLAVFLRGLKKEGEP